MCVKWGDKISDLFHVTNGVRQGGILSPYLFSVYIDDITAELNLLRIKCVIGNMIINHILYADDIVLIYHSSRGLHELIRCCERFGIYIILYLMLTNVQ